MSLIEKDILSTFYKERPPDTVKFREVMLAALVASFDSGYDGIVCSPYVGPCNVPSSQPMLSVLQSARA